MPPIVPQYVAAFGSEPLVNPLRERTGVSLGPCGRFDPDTDGPPLGPRDRA